MRDATTAHRVGFARKSLSIFAVMVIVLGQADSVPAKSESDRPAWDENVTQGALRIVDQQGQMVECPLKHTDAQANISGFLARVKVTQTFVNPTDRPIEATYVFPLPHQSAVDRMTMVIGDRRILGKIERRDEARRIYEQALTQGQTAALLEQQRPNIFTQSVGNIPAGEEVRVEISYVDSLRYDMGVYEFQFPMVVGPRYNPGSTTTDPPRLQEALDGKVAPPPGDTTRVPDASKINPPVLKPEFRNGHDISMTVHLDAGVPLRDMEISNHETTIVQTSPTTAEVRIDESDSIPNKDFLMRYTVVGEKPELALLNHTGRYSDDVKRLGEGYFMLMVQPKEKESLSKMPPREIIFLVDVSGSMRGEKTAKVIGAMSLMLKRCRPEDTIQVVTFASQAAKLFDQPVPVVDANVRKALDFSSQIKGAGGTRMLQGVKLAIDEPIDPERMRIVVMLTDGFIGNESEIIAHVGKQCGDQIRFWTIGVGSSPNMFLIDGVARQGGGLGKQLALNDDTASLVDEIMTRIQRAQLAKVSIDWGELQVRETYPTRIPELWAGRPIIVFGRYDKVEAPAEITIRGQVEGESVQWQVNVDLTQPQQERDVLARIWARRKIEDLMQSSYYQDDPAIEEAVTAIALDYELMTQYTSFVAVDEQASVTPGEPPVEMAVPVPLPEGAVWEGFFGELEQEPAPHPFGGLAAPGLTAAPASRAVAAAPVKRLVRLHSTLGRSPLPSARRPQSSATRNFAGQARGRSRLLKQSQPSFGFNAFFESARSRGVSSRGGVSRDKLYAYRSEARAAVVADQQSTKRRRSLLDQLGNELQKHLQADRLAVAQATLTAIRVLQQHISGEPPESIKKAPTAVELHRRELQVWRKRQPALDRRFSMQLRNTSVDQALKQVASETRVSISLEPGATADVQRLLNRDQIRVEFFDSKDKTLWQTLDAILYPLRLQWYVNDDKQVVVTTGRRRQNPSVWIYDVGTIALPTSSETADLKDPQKVAQTQKQQLDRFAKVVQEELDAESNTVDWFDIGQLRVYGSSEQHRKMSRLIDVMSGSGQATTPELREFAKATKKRIESRRDSLAKSRHNTRVQYVLGLHRDASWSLLSDAAIGQSDPRALAQLQIAWTDPVNKELLQEPSYQLDLARSYWAIRQASAWMPEYDELSDLCQTAETQVGPMLSGLNATTKEDSRNRLALFFGAMARSAAGETDALSSLAAQFESVDSTLSRLAHAMAAAAGNSDVHRMLDREIDRIDSAEMILLAALACHAEGATAWDWFRSNASDVMRQRPLPGEMIVLISRL